MTKVTHDYAIFNTCYYWTYIYSLPLHSRWYFVYWSNDGIEQMIPMQMYLYDKWSQGQFFYATDFGLGGLLAI